jgi:hypothetical protein
MSGLLLAVTGCAQMPKRLKVELDGRTIELKEREVVTRSSSDHWSILARCEAEQQLQDPQQLGQSIRVVTPDLLEVSTAQKVVTEVHGCPR